METIKKTQLGLRRGGKPDPWCRLVRRSSSTAIFYFTFVSLLLPVPWFVWGRLLTS